MHVTVLVSQKFAKSNLCISQGRVATRLSCGGKYEMFVFTVDVFSCVRIFTQLFKFLMLTVAIWVQLAYQHPVSDRFSRHL